MTNVQTVQSPMVFTLPPGAKLSEGPNGQQVYVLPASALGTDSFQASSAQDDKFSRISHSLGQFAAGGLAGFIGASNMVVDHDAGIMGQITGNLGNLAGSSLYGAGAGAAVGGVISAISNGVGVARGKVSSGQAMKNVIGDTITAAVGGLAGTFTGGLGAAVMNSFGLGGLPLVIGSVALGGLGSVLAGKVAGKLFHK